MTYLPFPAIELAMITRLKQASAADVGTPPAPLLGYRLRQVESYLGQLNGGPQRMAQAVRELPAVWLCFETAEERSDGLWHGTFTAVCVARNARNEKAARHGAGGDVGAYQLGRDVAALLEDQAFGLSDLGGCKPTKIDAPFNAEFESTRAAIVLVTFDVAWDADVEFEALPGEPNATAPGRFVTFHVDWDVPPFTTPRPAIPVTDATKRDARDVVNPPQ